MRTMKRLLAPALVGLTLMGACATPTLATVKASEVQPVIDILPKGEKLAKEKFAELAKSYHFNFFEAKIEEALKEIEHTYHWMNSVHWGGTLRESAFYEQVYQNLESIKALKYPNQQTVTIDTEELQVLLFSGLYTELTIERAW